MSLNYSYSEIDYYYPEQSNIKTEQGCTHSLYPHYMMRYTLDNHIIQPIQKDKKGIALGKPIHSYNRTEKTNISKRREDNYTPSQYSTNHEIRGTLVNINLQKSLGKFDTKNGGYNSQRELRGIVEEEPEAKNMHGSHIFTGYSMF
jgi:hypothetical protein